VLRVERLFDNRKNILGMNRDIAFFEDSHNRVLKPCETYESDEGAATTSGQADRVRAERIYHGRSDRNWGQDRVGGRFPTVTDRVLRLGWAIGITRGRRPGLTQVGRSVLPRPMEAVVSRVV
jgi:hypothetical protein